MGQGQSQSQDGHKNPSNQVGPKDRKNKRKSSGKGKERHKSNKSSSQLTSVPSSSNSYNSHSGDVNESNSKKGSSASHSVLSQAHHHQHHQEHQQQRQSSALGHNDVSPSSNQYNRRSQVVGVTDTSPSGAQRGSYHSTGAGGGERSAPSRQFSLTRQTSSTQNRHAQIEKYFNKYKDSDEDSILAEGMEKFCVDLSVDPTEFIVLVLAWKFEASQMCRFTREEFINGCQKMQAHNSKSLKERFPDLLSEAKEKRNFKDLYNFTFSFGLDHTSGQRSLPIDMATPLWDLVFTQNRPEVLEPWFKFLKDSGVRGISRDTWNMFLPFVESILPDLSNYDESEAWPSLFDDFVEAEVEKTAL